MPNNDKNKAADERPVPSQAEGDDEPEDLEANRPVPSQAEGDDDESAT